MPRDMVAVRRRGNLFRERPQVRIGRSQFDRSHGRKMSFDASFLYPILFDEVLPGDTFTLSTQGIARIFSPLDAPIMDNIEVETLFFFCPTRLLWSNWQYFQGEHDEAGAQDTTYTVPIMATGITFTHDNTGTAVANMGAYFGIPHGLQTTSVSVMAFPFRMYNRVISEWFRDQNLTDELTLNTDNGPDAAGDYYLQRSGKKHDYFTSCLPYLQKGTASTVAVSGTAYVHHNVADAADIGVYSDQNAAYRDMLASGTNVAAAGTSAIAGESLYVPLGTYGTVDINDLRQAIAIQRFLERDARGGTRYVEIIKSRFGVTSPDYRLQRPEYLGGGKSYINVSPVANTSATASEDQAELKGIGVGRITGGFAKSFTEHGYVMGLIRARADLTYFQGLDRHLSRSTLYDFYDPMFASLGEQAVLNKEIWISNGANDALTFGYQERWQEYRTKKSELVGLFNPDVGGSLSFWHLAEDFSSLPSLNTTFIQDQSPLDRVTTVDTEHDFIADIWFNYRCARPIPVFSIPSLVPRF